MNKLVASISLFLAAFVLGLSPSTQAQDLEEILDSHFEAMAIDNVLKIKTVKSTGKMIMMGGQMEMQVEQVQARPNKSRMEMDFNGNSFVTVFNGEEGWMINPMQGPDPQPLPEEQLDQMKQQSYIEGILYNHKEKGYEVELVGEDEIEGSPTFKLKVIPKEGNADSFFLHLDQDAYVILKIDAITNMQGQEIESETFLSNYKEVNGIPFPHSIETKANGQVFMEMIFESITLDEEVDEKLFESEK